MTFDGLRNIDDPGIGATQPAPRENNIKAVRTPRDIAVEIVDAIYGFTCEFNADPAWHAHVYDVMEERLTDALAAYDAAPAGDGWRPIESAPKDGKWLLLYGNGSGFMACTFVGYWGRRYADEPLGWQEAFALRQPPARPSHWRPLPPPPAPREGCKYAGPEARDD